MGTYTFGKSKGIYSFNFDALLGKPKNLKLVAKLENPRYLIINKNNTHLYSVLSSGNIDGCASFSIDENEDYLFTAAL
ncbi:beta-propeller fold lactonase family protein [Clostridium guangxiense]|uniref:beta-propeller fold lactonase family protein n=1 Tax=Clostridium guangxiense TaxID=1662055 RepID=UPI0038B2C862